MENQHNTDKKYTDEELAEMEAKMTVFYNKRLPFLRLKAEHDTLNMEIAEARIRTLQADHAYMQAQIQQAEFIKKAGADKQTSTNSNGNKDGSN